MKKASKKETPLTSFLSSVHRLPLQSLEKKLLRNWPLISSTEESTAIEREQKQQQNKHKRVAQSQLKYEERKKKINLSNKEERIQCSPRSDESLQPSPVQ
jgi:hypothetical protein